MVPVTPLAILILVPVLEQLHQMLVFHKVNVLNQVAHTFQIKIADQCKIEQDIFCVLSYVIIQDHRFLTPSIWWQWV